MECAHLLCAGNSLLQLLALLADILGPAQPPLIAANGAYTVRLGSRIVLADGLAEIALWRVQVHDPSAVHKRFHIAAPALLIHVKMAPDLLGITQV